MNKRFIGLAALTVTLVATFVVFQLKKPGNHQTPALSDYKNTEYSIDGQYVKLENGIAQTESVPGSEAKVVTRYFGNELRTDLNDDEREDIVFLLTQERGGSGVFFYAVAAINTGSGYVGSDGYFLGDRIAPQTTNISINPKHKNVIVVNYADRNLADPMTTPPSVGKSVYIKLNPETMQWSLEN